MSDAEKIAKMKAIISDWALDDNQGGGDAIVVLTKIMDIFEFDPYAEHAATTQAASVGGE